MAITKKQLAERIKRRLGYPMIKVELHPRQIDNALIIAIAIIVVFSLFTAGQRLLYVWKQTKRK